MKPTLKLALAEDHPIEKCWHPEYHLSPFKHGSAQIFFDWHQREFPSEAIDFAVPLCMFGGQTGSPYTSTNASGTDAVCPKCGHVMMCGWNDEGISPTRCDKCRQKLSFNDYFQPAFGSHELDDAERIDPERDPAVLLAEVLALAPDGIPVTEVAAIIAILTHEKLLQHGSAADDLAINDNRVESRLVKCYFLGGSAWSEIKTDRKDFYLEVTARGHLMLSVRGIKGCAKAKTRVRSLLAMGPEKIQATAWKALADMVL